MKQKGQRALRDYIRHTADSMGLRDWSLNLVVTDKFPEASIVHKSDEEKYGDFAIGCCSPIPGQRRATIYIHPDFENEPSDVQVEIIVHELVHCHLADMYEHMRIGVLNQVTQATYDALMFGFAQSWEHATDAIAKAWAESFKPIEWPK